MCEAICNFFSSEAGIGFSGAIIGALVGGGASLLAQWRENKAIRKQTELLVSKERQAILFDEWLVAISKLETDLRYVLDRHFYYLLLGLCSRSRVLFRDEVKKELFALADWIGGIQREFRRQENEIYKKYFVRVCLDSSCVDEMPVWTDQFVGRNIEDYEDELEKCKEENTPDKAIVNGKLESLIKLFRKEIFVGESTE